MFFLSWRFSIGQSPKLLLTSATVMEIGEITSRKLDHWPATVSSEALKSLTHCRCIVCVYPLAIKCNVAIDTPLQMEVYSWEIIYSINADIPLPCLITGGYLCFFQMSHWNMSQSLGFYLHQAGHWPRCVPPSNIAVDPPTGHMIHSLKVSSRLPTFLPCFSPPP